MSAAVEALNHRDTQPGRHRPVLRRRRCDGTQTEQAPRRPTLTGLVRAVTDHRRTKPQPSDRAPGYALVDVSARSDHVQPGDLPRPAHHPRAAVSVENLLEMLAGGMTIEEIIEDHPDLERDDLLAALEFGALASGQRRVVPLGAA